MSTTRAVAPLDVVEHMRCCYLLRWVEFAFDPPLLQRTEQAVRYRIVMAASTTAPA